VQQLCLLIFFLRNMKPYKYFLPLFTITLIIINIWSMIYLEGFIYYWILFGIMTSFFLLFISPWYYNKRGLFLFVLLFISDAILIFFEDPIFNVLMFLVKTASYLVLVGIVLNKLRNLRTNLFQKIVFTIAVLLNIFLLYSIVEMMPVDEYSLFFDFLFYIYGLAIIICVSAAVSYSNRYASRPSIFFLTAVLCLVLSDLNYFIGFILDFSEFFYADRVFNILGIGALLHFLHLERLGREDIRSHLDE